MAGLALGTVYNVFQFRDLIGNFALAGTYGIAAVMASDFSALLFPVAFMLLTFAHNLMVQIEDMEADRKVGVLTVPIQLGVNWTRAIAFAVASFTAGLFANDLVFVPFVISCVCVAVAAAFANKTVIKVLVRVGARLGMLIGFLVMGVVACWG
jgi:4-hydroxybenzoate polyprenyltransferase